MEEETAGNEQTVNDPRVRMKISRLSSGKFTYEVTARGETVTEATGLLEIAKAELERLTKIEEEGK